jgi:hypothetical protein
MLSRDLLIKTANSKREEEGNRCGNKCQLDATDEFLLQVLLLPQQPANRTHNPQLHTIPTT